MSGKELSLKGLEVFQSIARTGSVQAVAIETGLSLSTVSHHLKALEDNLGVALIDHGRRPMVLTPSGSVFLRYVEEGLRSIKRGRIELTSGRIEKVQHLRLGVVDDFDGEIAPELAQILAQLMPKCTFHHRTRPSYEILGLLARNELDIAVTARPPDDTPGLIEYPLLRDPFVVATPANSKFTVEELMAGKGDLPFLWYPKSQLIGHQINLQLRRQRISFEKRYEMESNQMLLAMIAGGAGWAITTAASYMRVKRLHNQVAISTLPIKKFSRTVSLFATEIYAQPVIDLVYAAFHRLIAQRFVEPAIAEIPWLADTFLLLKAPGAEERAGR